MNKPNSKLTGTRRRLFLAWRVSLDPLEKEGFPSKRKSKLMPRLDGPFEILQKIGPNA